MSPYRRLGIFDRSTLYQRCLVSLGLCRRLRHPGFLSPAVSLFQLALCHEIGGNRYISSCATHDRLYASRPDRDAAQARSAGLFDIIDELADELRSGGRWRPGRCAVMHHIEKRLVIVDVPDVAETVQESWINVVAAICLSIFSA
jgi:hypothetical protein